MEVIEYYCSFVSLIDREGRSLVKCSSYQACNEVSQVDAKHGSVQQETYLL